MRAFVGLDWGSAHHAACVIDAGGKIVDSFELAHTRDGLATLIKRLRKRGDPQDMLVSIERPSGLLVDTLVDAGFVVVPIHPNVVKACRPRYRAVGAKSDPGDAYILADILRTDGHRLTPLKPQSDAIKALRALVRGREDLIATRVTLSNQLRALLETFWPGATQIFYGVDTAIGLAFLERYPTPESASRLGEKRLAAFLAQHGYSGRRPIPELLARLRGAASGLNQEGEADAKGEVVRALVRSLERIVVQIARITARIEHAVALLPEGQVMMSFPRAGKVCAAQIVAELGDVPERFQSEEQLASEAGVAPVTYASGKSRSVGWRWACNKRLRAAVTCFADNSRHGNAWAASIYQRARDRGCSHPHAIRVLARAWIRVLWRAWRDQTPYDPSKHCGALLLNGASLQSR